MPLKIYMATFYNPLHREFGPQSFTSCGFNTAQVTPLLNVKINCAHSISPLCSKSWIRQINCSNNSAQ